MVNSNYNKKQHYKLLKEKLTGVNLEEDSSQLRGYSCMLMSQLDWESRESYLKLLEDLQKGKIEDVEFCFAFEERGLLINDMSDMLESNLILLSSHEKSSDFSSFVDLIIDICKSYIENAEDNNENSRIEFRKEMEEIFLRIQEIFKEDEISRRDSIDFLKLVDQLNWEAKDEYFELIEEFLNESNESSNFLNFKEKDQSLVKVAKKLESNSIFLKPSYSYQALGFSNFSRILIQLFDRYQVDPDLSPKTFKSWVQKILLEMKNHYA